MPLRDALPPEALDVLSRATRLTTPCGDGELVWHAWGRGAPLVLLHGGSGSWTHWIRNVEPLASSGRRVLVPDLPGFGDSARPPADGDADAVVAPVAEGLRIVGAGEWPVDLVGFSFGGLVGTLLTAEQPDLVRRLVLVGAPGMGLRAERIALRPWRGLPDPQRLAAHRHNLEVLMLHRPEAVDSLAVALQAANVPHDRMQRRRLALTDLLARTLPALACRVDAIYGEHDVLYAGLFDELRARVAVAPRFGEFVTIPGAGHWVQYEAPDALDAVLLRLLGIR